MELIARKTGRYSTCVTLPPGYYKKGDPVTILLPNEKQETNPETQTQTDTRFNKIEEQIRELQNAKPIASRGGGLSDADLKEIRTMIQSEMADHLGN